MANDFYGAISLTGGTEGALDNIDGTDLADGDGAVVITATHNYVYILDDDSAAGESSPDIIEPDANGGTKRWILVAMSDQDVSKLSVPTHAGINLEDSGLTNPLTSLFYTINTWFQVTQEIDNQGGANLRAISTNSAATGPIRIQGVFGESNPVDAVPAVVLDGSKRAGTSWVALGAAETVLQIKSIASIFATVLGNGYTGFGTVIPAAKIHVVGDARIGDQATNYTQFSATGVQTMAGTARINQHFRIGASSFFKKDNPPENDLVGIIPVLKFDAGVTDEQAYYSDIVPFKMLAGSAIVASVDWCYEGGADAGTVVWGIEFINVATGEAVAGGTTTITGKSAGTHTSGALVSTAIDDVANITGAVADDVLALRVFRDSSDGVNDTLAVDACLVQVHLHFIMDKLGEAT